MVRSIPQRKQNIVNRLCKCFLEFKQIIVVKLDNVSTGQIQKARAVLRSQEPAGEMIVGKNTLIHKAIEWVTTKASPGDAFYEQRKDVGYRPELAALKDKIRLNVGLIFCDGDYQKLRNLVEAEVLEMPAKAGVLAPCNVALPPGPTNLDTGKIDLFHKLNIPVKVAKGTIEIQKEFPIIAKGEKVTEAAALMCRTLNLTPFRYTLSFIQVFLPSGQIIGEEVICMEDEKILELFANGVRALTGLSLGANFPNQLSVPHMFANSFKCLLALGVASGYQFKELREAMDASANAAANTQAAGGDDNAGDDGAQDAPEEEPEDEDISAGGLFGDSDSSSD